MKKASILILLFLLALSASAQSEVTYNYDSAGNRTNRMWTTQRQNRRVENDSLVPVIPPVYIDSLSPKSVNYSIKIEPNNIPLVLSEEEKYVLNEEFFKGQRAEEQAWWEEYTSKGVRSLDTTKTVGAIPLQSGVSPTGARTYRLPIPTAAGFKLVPNISLAYNSQASEGWAGYGWDIQGLSCIRLINKNQYYHGQIKAADINASDPVFALDGVPLVTNEHAETSSAYPLETARGHILAAKETNSYGRVTKFTVLYPNGIRAVYGRDHTYNYNLVFYRLTQMQDLEGNRITFSYTPDAQSGNDLLTNVRYGYDSSGNHAGEISFTYTNWTNSPIRYFAGAQVRYNKRLTSIETRSDGEVLATYSFTYQQKGPLWLINKIDCSTGSSSISPIEFTYSTVPASQYLKKSDSYASLNLSFFNPFITNQYKRGKFISHEFRDGLLIYPHFEYGYASNQVIIFVPVLERTNVVDTTSLLCGDGFQTIDAADIDGDGVDEIVRINRHDTHVGEYTRFTITIYGCNANGTPQLENSFDILLKGVAGISQAYPYKRDFRWGDFNGDGKADLLAVAYNTNYPYSYTQTCYAAIIDMSSHHILSDEELFTYTYNGRKNLIICDIDNDGRTELCNADPTGFKIYRLQSNGHFALENALSSPNSDVLSNPNRLSYLADFNGDGYLDIAHAPATYNTSSSWTFYYYNGKSFTTRTVSLAQSSAYTEAMFMDVNHDGMADMVAIKQTSDTTATLGTYINKNGYSFNSYQVSPDGLKDDKGIVPVNMSAYNTPSAFMKVDGLSIYFYSYQGITGASRLITKEIDSYGAIHSSGYSYLPSRSATWSDASLTVNTSQGFKFFTLPIYVLSNDYDYLSSSPSSYYKVNEYEYDNGVIHNRGLGFCGFSRIRTKIKPAVQTFTVNDVIDQYYNPEGMGVLTKTVRKKGLNDTDPAYYTLINTWDNHTTTYGKLNPRMTQSIVNDALTGVNILTYYTYDTWDFTTEIRSTKTLSGCPDLRERQKKTFQHSNTATKYVLGSITKEESWSDLDNITTRQWKNKTITILDTLFRPLTKKAYVGISRSPAASPFVESTDSTQLVSETRWTYDSHGKILSEKSAPYGATEFIGHTYTYDSNGRYLLTDTDALGRTTTYANYNKFGKPEKVTDYRNRITYFSYDPWGKQTHKVLPTGAIESTIYAWGGSGVYTVNNIESGKPETVTHYDALDREVRNGIKRFDGQWQYTDTQYNRYGQVSKVSLPFRGSSASYWNTYTYDKYHRPIKILAPSGKQTTWAYSGTSTTTVKEGITSVKTTDASGNVVTVSDAGGTITYTLRDDGQPSSITAPWDVVTSFTYDVYGRRTSIVDPSAGTQSEAYVWNSDGSHQQTHTGPNGSITTIWDKFGRTTAVQRLGMFNTTYTYNSYGQLSAESSTNGTGTEYTYDSYDRVSTVKETVPDGKWLKKTYTYSGWRTLSSIKYTTQDGDITTETYTYANNNNTGIKLPDNTSVWNLVSENDLGQPTQITTGGVNRYYRFTDYGLPSYRVMTWASGILQNFQYQFDPLTGNLDSSSDRPNSTDTYDYDALNRLTRFGQTEVTYTSNGNIRDIDNVAEMSYSNISRPYQVTAIDPYSATLVPDRTQEITYNSLDRPSVLEEGYKTATFTYNGSSDRVKMVMADYGTPTLTRYYIGGQYECDVTQSGTKERLYLGGDAYSAPMVLQRTDNGSWTAYNIGRDYHGNITHIATTGGTLVAEYSYDPWGRLRNPQTHAIYTPGNEPDLFLGRGFTGHEHLTWFGLINMNARLYDPLLGRFLSPDPYVQAPDFTQNINRYSYALNNPLRYTDQTGGFVLTAAMTVGIALGCFFGSMTGSYLGFQRGATGMDMIGYMLGGAAIGGLAGFAGGVAGSALASISNSGFLGGALAGGASSAASGFVTVTGFSKMNGSTLGKSLINGFISGGVGFLLGGITGGLFSGISSKLHGGNFWTGEGAAYECFGVSGKRIGVGEGMEYSNEYAMDHCLI